MGEERSIELRRLATATIAVLRLAEYAPDLRASLDGADDELVARAAKGLGEIGDSEGAPRLLALLDSDRPWFVKLSAVVALGKIGDPDTVPPLAILLTNGNWQLREVTARALAALGPAGRGVLERAGTGDDREASVRARVALES
jgi:HEAT repeat protein